MHFCSQKERYDNQQAMVKVRDEKVQLALSHKVQSRKEQKQDLIMVVGFILQLSCIY